MVAYGATLRRARRPGWEDAYLEYESLRSILEEIEALCRESSTPANALPAGYDPNEDAVNALEQQFLARLRKEIEKVSLFTLTRQGEIAEAVGSLRFGPDANLTIQPTLSRPRLPQYGMSVEDENENENDEYQDVPSAPDSYDDEGAELLPRGSVVSGPLKTPKPIPKTDEQPRRPMFRSDVLSLVRSSDSTVDTYTALGVELLHLLKFICVNAMGIRKILKKHDKVMLRAEQVFSDNENEVDDRSKSEHQKLVGGPEDHLQQLANSASVAAIYSSLLAELMDLETKEMGGTTNVYQAIEEGGGSDRVLMQQMDSYPVSLVRFKCTVSSIHTLREYAQRVHQRFQAFLSNQALIVTGHDPGGLERSTQKALSLLLRFQPDALLLMDEAALEDWERRIVSRSGVPEDDASIGDLEIDMDSWGGLNSISMIINLMSTLLYTVNYYIVAPTANHYAILLGTQGAFGATLVGASSFAAIFAAFLYSFWYTKSSFRSVLLFSAFCPCIGNLLYALAISYGSMKVAIWGRILVGFGSAEVVNRQMISACVSFQNMTEASALFVAAGAIGMSVGPLLAAILDMVSGRDTMVDLKLPFMPSGGIIYNHVSSPGFVMSCLWFAEILALLFIFREPERINGSKHPLGKRTSALVSFESEPSLSKYGTITTTKPANTRLVRTRNWWKNVWSQFLHIKDLVFSNMALPVTLLLFGFIELVDEVLISSCSMVCRRYFSWNGSHAGFLIACLGALVLPAHYVVERASRTYSERRIMKVRGVSFLKSFLRVQDVDMILTLIGALLNSCRLCLSVLVCLPF